MSVNKWKEIERIGIVFGVIGSILAMGVGFGIHKNALANVVDVVNEVKLDVKEEARQRRKVDLEHSKILASIAAQLEGNMKNIDRIQKKLDQESVN